MQQGLKIRKVADRNPECLTFFKYCDLVNSENLKAVTLIESVVRVDKVKNAFVKRKYIFNNVWIENVYSRNWNTVFTHSEEAVSLWIAIFSFENLPFFVSFMFYQETVCLGDYSLWFVTLHVYSTFENKTKFFKNLQGFIYTSLIS